MLAINNAVGSSAGLFGPYIMGDVVQSAGASAADGYHKGVSDLWARRADLRPHRHDVPAARTRSQSLRVRRRERACDQGSTQHPKCEQALADQPMRPCRTDKDYPGSSSGMDDRRIEFAPRTDPCSASDQASLEQRLCAARDIGDSPRRLHAATFLLPLAPRFHERSKLLGSKSP